MIRTLASSAMALLAAMSIAGAASAQIQSQGVRNPLPPATGGGGTSGGNTGGSTGTISGKVYYVSTSGSNYNPGTVSAPFQSVEGALVKVGGGNTIIVMPGTYTSIGIADNWSGTQQSPTIVKAQVKWMTRIVGSKKQGIVVGSTNAQWVVIDGFEVMGSFYDGIKVNGDHDTVRNCWSHNNRTMGMAAHGFTGTVFENNLIEFNGQHPGLDHGIYADGDQLTVRRNIVRHNACVGLHLWPSISNSVICNNIVSDNTDGIYIGGVPGAPNTIANNTVLNHTVGLKMYTGDSDIVVNNIIIGRPNTTDSFSTIELVRTTVVIRSDYNLCVPPNLYQGAHGLSVDPQLATVMGWLKGTSPAIGRGTWQYAPTTDFWGRTLPTGTPPAMGAIAYSAYLASPTATAGWYNGQPYCSDPDQPTRTVPDFWIPPLF